MKPFMCPACGVKISPMTIWNRYEEAEDAFTCAKCTTRAKLRHFTKGVTYNQINKYRNKCIMIWSVISIPFQVLVYLKILNWIFGG